MVAAPGVGVAGPLAGGERLVVEPCCGVAEGAVAGELEVLAVLRVLCGWLGPPVGVLGAEVVGAGPVPVGGTPGEEWALAVGP